MSEEPKTAAMKLANWGSGLAFAAILLGPLVGIPGMILGFIALSNLTPEEKAGSMNDNGKVKNKAWTAVIGGFLLGIVIPIILILTRTR